MQHSQSLCRGGKQGNYAERRREGWAYSQRTWYIPGPARGTAPPVQATLRSLPEVVIIVHISSVSLHPVLLFPLSQTKNLRAGEGTCPRSQSWWEAGFQPRHLRASCCPCSSRGLRPHNWALSADSRVPPQRTDSEVSGSVQGIPGLCCFTCIPPCTLLWGLLGGYCWLDLRVSLHEPSTASWPRTPDPQAASRTHPGLGFLSV